MVDDRAVGWREVLIVAAAVVGIVLGLAFGTSLLPTDTQRLVFRTPLLIAVLIGGHRPRPGPPGPPTARSMTAVLDARRRDLERLAAETWRRAGGGWWDHRRGDRSSTRPAAAFERRWSSARTTPSARAGRSSRLIHGGLRYLEQVRIGLVRRGPGRAAAAAPPRPPPGPHRAVHVPDLRLAAGPTGFYGAGLTLYDLLGASRGRRLRTGT